MNDHDMGRWVRCEPCEGNGRRPTFGELWAQDYENQCEPCDGEGRLWLSLEEEVEDGVG